MSVYILSFSKGFCGLILELVSAEVGELLHCANSHLLTGKSEDCHRLVSHLSALH